MKVTTKIDCVSREGIEVPKGSCIFDATMEVLASTHYYQGVWSSMWGTWRVSIPMTACTVVEDGFKPTTAEQGKLRMYILIPDWVPTGKAVVAAAHASLACYLKYQYTDAVKAWLSGTFFKVVCKVTPEEFERAKNTGEHVVLTESTLQDREVAIAFAPRAEGMWPSEFKKFSLYK